MAIGPPCFPPRLPFTSPSHALGHLSLLIFPSPLLAHRALHSLDSKPWRNPVPKTRWKPAAPRLLESRGLASRRLCCLCKTIEGGSNVLDLAVDSKQLASEREEAKAVVIQYLKNRGRELTTLEIRNTLLPYLEGLAAEYGDGLVDILFYFPNPPPSRKEDCNSTVLNGVSPKVISVRSIQLRRLNSSGLVRPSLLYMLALGLTLDQVQASVQRFPSIAYCNPEKKIKPIVDYFMALGVSYSDLPKIFRKRPQIFGCSLEENLKPTLIYLESLGVNRNQWARILVHFPALLTYSTGKIERVVVFLYELGLSPECVSKILTRFPHITGYSVEDKLKPMAQFLEGFGVKNVGTFIRKSPPVMGYSIEGNIKPTISFFLELGFSMEEVVAITNRYPNVLGLAIEQNLRPKWDYFVQTGWPKSQILVFPQYFGYSLKSRIKPRFEKIIENQLVWTINRMLSTSEKEFQRNLKREGVH